MRLWQTIFLISIIAAGIPAVAQTRGGLDGAHIIHRQAFDYQIAKDYDSALKLYEKSAAMGLAKSEYNIGHILAFERDAKRELKAALPWFIRALEPRDVHQGQGFAQARIQAQEALDWYCKNGAAEFPEEHPSAQDPKCWHGRAKALMFGWFDIEKDNIAAKALLNKSIAAGWNEAQPTLDKLNRRAETRARKSSPIVIDKKHLLFVLFMMFVVLLFLRSIRFRQLIFGLLYRNST